MEGWGTVCVLSLLCVLSLFVLCVAWKRRSGEGVCVVFGEGWCVYNSPVDHHHHHRLCLMGCLGLLPPPTPPPPRPGEASVQKNDAYLAALPAGAMARPGLYSKAALEDAERRHVIMTAIEKHHSDAGWGG